MAIGFYFKGPITLPHDPLPRATLLVIESAIAEAWKIIRDRPEGDFDINTADEDRITRELRTCLENAVLYGGSVPGFTPDGFYISREAKYESFDGKHLDKMPDIHIRVVCSRVVGIPSMDGLFIECKPVDKTHAAGAAYCDRGIVRYVAGEYAWAMPQALMVGYASKGYTLPEKLDNALKSRVKSMKVKTTSAACPDHVASGYTQLAHVTTHGRGFKYPNTGKLAPDITLRHLWFDRN